MLACSRMADCNDEFSDTEESDLSPCSETSEADVSSAGEDENAAGRREEDKKKKRLPGAGDSHGFPPSVKAQHVLSPNGKVEHVEHVEHLSLQPKGMLDAAVLI